jgi:serine/threonine protein phosphatase PrpC
MAFKKYGVSCIPFTTKHVITEKDLFLVLASDGVWDTVTEDDLIEICTKNINLATGKLSEMIVNYAMEQGSQDNISCLLIRLN